MDYLEHHGVKGMHWGIRKVPQWQLNYGSKVRNRRTNADKKAERQAKKDARTQSAYKRYFSVTAKNKHALNSQIRERLITDPRYRKEFAKQQKVQQNNPSLKSNYKSIQKSLNKTKKKAIKSIEGTKNFVTGKNALNQSWQQLRKVKKTKAVQEMNYVLVKTFE